MSWASYLGTITCPACDIRFSTSLAFDEHLIKEHDYQPSKLYKKKRAHNMTEEKKDALAQVPSGMEDMVTADRPEGADDGVLGNEGIGREDILMPRLALAQKMSPEIDVTNAARYIQGLQFTDLFNSLTRKVYGKGPLHFVILRRDNPRYIEFRPISEGGGVVDMNVAPTDPRTRFTTGPNGERVKPVATMFYDYVVLLLTDFNPSNPIENVVALSLKSSAIKAAKHLNLLISQRGSKLICKGVYELTTGSDTDKKSGGTYATYKIKNAGWLKPNSAIEKLAIEMFESWKERDLVVDRDAEQHDDATDFNPAEYDREEKTTAPADM